MRKLLQKWLKQPIIRLSNKYSTHPDTQRVHEALTKLYENLYDKNGKRGIVIPFDAESDKFIILSDQHKGARNHADDFALAEKNYLAALHYYNAKQYHYINLGDSEELWENRLSTVKRCNRATFEAERLFLERMAFIKIFGNHDLYWDNDPLAAFNLQSIYKQPLKVYEGLILQTRCKGKPLSIYLTHGHQGDLQSDGNWFSKWFVSKIWAPLQSFLEINPNTPATNNQLKTLHNQIMYDWSSRQENLLLITGHTHQPVFQSLTHLEHLYIALSDAQKAGDAKLEQLLQQQINKLVHKGHAAFNFPGYKPTYFNSGCCCFDDGDITGIEIAGGYMRLVKWEYDNGGKPSRIVLEENTLEAIVTALAVA